MKKDRPLTLYEKQKIEKPSVKELADEYLNDELNKQLSDFIAFLEQNKMIPRLYTTNLFQVTHKGKNVLKIRMANGPKLQKNIYTVSIGIAEAIDLNEFLMPLSNDMKNFYFNNIRLCQHCSKCPPKSMTVLDKKIENYCETGIGVNNPTEQQYEYIKKFVILRKEYIRSKG